MAGRFAHGLALVRSLPPETETMHSPLYFPKPVFFSSLALLLAIAAGSAGCGGSGGGSSSGTGGGSGGGTGGNSADHGSVFVGVTSDFRVGVDIESLRVRRWIGEAPASDETLTASGGGEKLTLPAAFPFTNIEGGEKVTIQLDAFRAGDMVKPVVSRLASTKVIAGASILLRAPLDTRCAPAPGSAAPVCATPDTCIAGACAPSFVDPRGLPAYDASWSAHRDDVCKPIGGGAPVVTVGEGQSDYLPMQDLDVAQLEAGPQGGHHVWVAIRMKNLLQSGSITKVSGEVPELGLAIHPFQVIFTFDQDEGGFCKLYGLRFQVDQERDVQDLLGKVVKIKVEVTDKDGDVGVGERTVTLSNTIL